MPRTAGIESTGIGEGGTGAGRPGRDLALSACACLLAAGSAIHGAFYPRTFNARPPAAIRAATEAASIAILPEPDSRLLRPRVALVVVDGLRDDAARGLGLEGVAARDAALPPLARCALQVYWPSFSVPGYATIATGAPPALSGVHNNWFRGPVELDSVFARAEASGRSVGAVADESEDWRRLFPTDLCFQESGAEAFARATGTLFRDGSPACDLTLLHTLVVDAAAHREGAASEAYARAVATTGAWLRAAIARMDPARDTLVVTSDHGQVDRGGHGGVEPVVLRVPLFLVGRGVRRGAPAAECDGRRLSDLAPTLAVLIGVEPPRQAVGTILRPMLSLDPAVLDAADAASRRSRAALAGLLGRSDGDAAAAVGPPRGPAVWPILLGLAAAAGLAGLLLLLAGPATGEAASTSTRAAARVRCGGSAVIYPALAWAILLLVGPGASFSSKGGDLPEYALRAFLLLSVAAIVGLGAHVLAFSDDRPEVTRRARAVALACAAASWPIAIGLHGSPFGAPLGEPHLSFAVVLGCLATSVGCGYLALILTVDAALAWRAARRAARIWPPGYRILDEIQPERVKTL